ncbi:hypothetical protein ACFTZI_20890 [Streptomyces decoyicus]|uniref:hypothetical protein n=1 Tax=Streptomyces decoyicus TaxID=249567 RepID=UPI003641C1B5
MPSAPDDDTAERLRNALRTAASALKVTITGTLIWGWEGKSLSGPVEADRWLRLLSIPAEREPSWDGPQAAEAVPDTVPRPRLHDVRVWKDEQFAYRAEIYDRVSHQPISDGALLDHAPDLPAAWWSTLRTSLDTVASVETDRVAIRQERLRWALPQFLGAEVETDVPAWSTAHADIQWSNLVGPDLCIFDWERWGLAPVGYDAATLFISSLTLPEMAARVRREFADVLDTPAGRFSELVVASEFLQGMQRGNNLELEGPLRQRVAYLLGE